MKPITSDMKPVSKMERASCEIHQISIAALQAKPVDLLSQPHQITSCAMFAILF